MYVCVCKAVNDAAIRKAVSEGATCFRDVSSQTGCGTQCGSCVKQACEIMNQAMYETSPRNCEANLEVFSLA